MQEFLLLLIQIPVLPWSCFVHRNWAILVESQGGYPTNFCRGFQTPLHTVEKTIEIHENHLAHINSHSYVTFTSPYRWLGTQKGKKNGWATRNRDALSKGWDVPSRIRCNWTNRLDEIHRSWDLPVAATARWRAKKSSISCRRYCKSSSFLNFPMKPWTARRLKMSTFQMTESRDVVLLKSPHSDSRWLGLTTHWLYRELPPSVNSIPSPASRKSRNPWVEKRDHRLPSQRATARLARHLSKYHIDGEGKVGSPSQFSNVVETCQDYVEDIFCHIPSWWKPQVSCSGSGKR